MNLLLIFTIGIAVAAGVYLILARDIFRLIIGLAVLGSLANLILFMGGRPGSLIAPVIEKGAAGLPAGFADPLPQALTLTAIVIGFALLAFALVLGTKAASRGSDPDQLRASEPKHHDAVKPPIEEE
jgi:multicomponent Na+:H+ antiporter subunit C